MLIFEKSTCIKGKISRAKHRQVSHRPDNIVIGGAGKRGSVYGAIIKKFKGIWFFRYFFPSVPRTFGDYCLVSNSRNMRY